MPTANPDQLTLFLKQAGVELPRPRHLEDPQVALTARGILDDLREEINKSLASEYAHEAHR